MSRAATHPPQQRLSFEEYMAWAETDPPGRYELVDGQVVAMVSERVRHNRAKRVVFQALERAVEAAGLPCEVFTDGIGVRTGKATVREPDASVQCGATIDGDERILDAPIIVVEVVSPGSGLMDTSRKLVEYLGVPSIQHYLIIDPEQGAIIHHARDGDGARTAIHRSGVITLDPPGLRLEIDAVIVAGRGKTGGGA